MKVVNRQTLPDTTIISDADEEKANPVEKPKKSGEVKK